MNDKKITLNEEDFSFLCPMKTEDMTTIEGGYFCGECNKKVHDVSDMSKSEYEKLVEKTDDICISFKKIATVSLALSVAACASPEKSRKPLLGKKKINSKCVTIKQEEHNNTLMPYEKVVANNKISDTNKTKHIIFKGRRKISSNHVTIKQEENNNRLIPHEEDANKTRRRTIGKILKPQSNKK